MNSLTSVIFFVMGLNSLNRDRGDRKYNTMLLHSVLMYCFFTSPELHGESGSPEREKTYLEEK